MELWWEGGYTTVYNLTFVLTCNFAKHKSDLSPNQTQVDLSFLKDTTRRSCLRLRPQLSKTTASVYTEIKQVRISRKHQAHDLRTPHLWSDPMALHSLSLALSPHVFAAVLFRLQGRGWYLPQSNQSAGPVCFLIFDSISIFLLASPVAGRKPQWTTGADQQGMYSTIPIHWNIKSAPASPGRSRVGPAFNVLSFLGIYHTTD